MGLDAAWMEVKMTMTMTIMEVLALLLRAWRKTMIKGRMCSRPAYKKRRGTRSKRMDDGG